MNRIGFGGGCHWCTEAIFQSLKGVDEVQQGWIASEGSDSSFSEAIIVNFDINTISQDVLVSVHLHTHSCTANHSMRTKYRSAVYVFSDLQAATVRRTIEYMQTEFEQPIITAVLPLSKFELNTDEYLNYYYKDPKKPFCENIIGPKLKLLLENYAEYAKPTEAE